jgi:teichuronic acid biosynthesis glycosyltransferase TuaC
VRQHRPRLALQGQLCHTCGKHTIWLRRCRLGRAWLIYACGVIGQRFRHVTRSTSDQRRRIVFVTPWYPVPDSPAAGVFVREHARAAAMFDDVAVVHLVAERTMRPGLFALERVPDEPFPVIRARYRAIRHVGWLAELSALAAAMRDLRARGFTGDVLHAHIASGAAAAAVYSRITGLPMILSEHSTVYLDSDPHSLGGVEALRSRFALKRAAKVLPVSSTLEAAMRRLAPDADYEVVPNVIDCERFRPPSVRPQIQPTQLIAVGLLSPQKDYPTMLRAIRELVEADVPIQLKIVGYGDCQAELARMIDANELADHVELVGYLPKAEVAERLRGSHVFVHSSRFETFCAAAAEALASGVPVVSTRCGGPEDYITHETGRLVPVGDPGALAAAVQAVIEQLDSFKPDRIAGHAREHFAPQVVAHQLHELYTSANGARSQ